MNEIKLGLKVEAEKLFNAVKNSGYLKKKGYKVLYANKHFDEKKKEVEVEGIKIKKAVKSDKISGYKLCFHTDTKKAGGFKYVHLRILGAGVVSCIHYFVTMGDEKKIEEDLINLVKEIKSKFSKK